MQNFVEIKFTIGTILLPGNTAPQTGRVHGCTQNIPGKTLWHTNSLYLEFFFSLLLMGQSPEINIILNICDMITVQGAEGIQLL
jgi:hypothetical protein